MGLVCSVYECMHFRKSSGGADSKIAEDQKQDVEPEVSSENAKSPDTSETPERHSSGLLSLSFAYLSLATQNFNDMSFLGEDETGKLYKGFLSNSEKALADGSGNVKIPVAIKRLNFALYQNHKGWLDDVASISTLHHPNLINVIGFCLDESEACLVYEFMPNGNLNDTLFASDFADALTWNQRIAIGINIASGLSQLIESGAVHRNLRASNILLDENYFAKITDYGLATSGLIEGQPHPSIKILTDLGYLDPAYSDSETGFLTGKSDVYSLGVVLFELISGQPCVSEKKENLLLKFRPEMSKKWFQDFKAIVDPKLRGKYPQSGAAKLFQLIVACTNKDASARPEADKVIFSLKAVDKNKS